MIPRIIDKSVNIEEVDYVDLSGYGALPDILEGSFSKEELHTGVLTLAFDYPCDGINANMLVGDNYVLYKINSYEDPHLFIINQIEKDTDDLVYSVFCDSITYLADLDVTSYFQLNKGATPNDFINKLNNVGDFKKIRLSTDINGSLPNGFLSKTLRNKVDLINSESKDSFIRGFGGYLKRYKNNIQILKRRGTNRPEVLTYGDDLLEVSCEYDYSEMVTAVKYICVEDSDGYVVESPIIYADNNTTRSLKHLKVISISKYELQREFGYIPEIPLLTMLNNKANSYFNSADNVGISEPDVSLKVKIDEKKTIYGRLFNNYKDFEFKIGDRVELRVDKLGINITSEISSINYDGVLEEIKELTFGKVKRYINTPYKEEFEAPNSTTTGFNSNDWAEQIARSLFPDLNEVSIAEPVLPKIINDGGAPSFTLDRNNVTIADGAIWSDPIITPILKNVDSNEIYILDGMIGTLGDLYGPKSANLYDNNEIVNGSRLKYMEYSEGRVKFKWSQWLADCNASGINETHYWWDEYIFHPPHEFTIDLAVKNATSSYGGLLWVRLFVTVAGTLGEDNPSNDPSLNDPLNPFEYLYYMQTTEYNSKLMFYLSSRMLLHQAIITNEVNVKSIFDGSSISEDNLEISQKMFDKIVELAIVFHNKETPDIAIRDFTAEEYLIYRDAYVNSRLGITNDS